MGGKSVSLGTNHSGLSSAMLEELGLVILRGVSFLSLAVPTSDLALAECAGGPEVSSAKPRVLCDCEHTRWDHKGEMELATPCLAWPETPSRLLGWICWALLGRKGRPWAQRTGPESQPHHGTTVAVDELRGLTAPWFPSGKMGLQTALISSVP